MTVDEAPVPRPHSLDPDHLGFTPRPPVGWLQPVQLAGTALRVVLSETFGAYLDKRELQGTLPDTVADEATGREELWFDFIADIGDGFDPTYSMAYLLAQPSLTVDGHELPRGQVLMMGGDEVYPTASTLAYEDRTKGPYAAASPVLSDDPPTLYALPGNHDWYDGLTAFLRLFVKDRGDHLGGWVKAQARSYFAMELPRRWWLFAIDTQFGTYIDDPQLRYFRRAAERIQPDDKVILCSANPGWVEAVETPGAYDALDYFVRTVLAPTGAQIRLMLSGDLHHYARYEGPDRQLIHCGGGGAYLYPTHKLPDQIQVPPPASRPRRQTPSAWYRRAATFPSRATSRAYAGGVFARLPLRNRSFIGLLGLLHMLFALSLVAQFRHASGTERRLLSIPTAIMGVIIVAACVFFAMPESSASRAARHWIAGASHGVVHLGLGVLGTWAWAQLPFPGWEWPLPVLAAVVLYLPVSGLVATEVVCLYLLLAGAARVNLNELFAGQGIIDSKSFLRLHFAPDGSLTIYPIGVDRVCRRWTAQPDAPANAPWFRPATPLVPRLIEPPIRID